MSTTDLIAKLRERTSFSDTDFRLHRQAADALTALQKQVAEQAAQIEALLSEVDRCKSSIAMLMADVIDAEVRAEPDWDYVRECAEETTGLKVERHTYSIVIREVRKWLARNAAMQSGKAVQG